MAASPLFPPSVPAYRPPIEGYRHAVSAGHYLAAHAGFSMFQAGGNAIDAGVAGGIALGVVQSNFVSFAGVAPIIIYSAEHDELISIDGLGVWPKAAHLELFEKDHGGTIPVGVLRTVVPGAPDAWITALERYGTMSFAEVAEPAIRFARDGIAMYPLMTETLELNKEAMARWDSTAAIYQPGGRVQQPGERFIQADLGRSLQYMADEDKAAASRGREAGLKAARDAFYKGDLAKTFCDYHGANGGLLTMEDMAAYSVTLEPPAHIAYGDLDVYTCGPWCQGPVLLQTLQLLKGYDLKALGHNSADYIHTIAEALKLTYSDRERYYGDPKFVDVPLDVLLSDDYAAERRAMIRNGEAWPEMPPAGELVGGGVPSSGVRATGSAARAPLDTSYVCAVDDKGNVFSATPSDVANDTPVIPGTGLTVSSRGAQSWAQTGHASAVAPGKRPRLTPNPGLAIRQGKMQMPFGTPGGDVQSQAMLQAVLNIEVFEMNVQRGVEEPRFATQNFPNSFEPHAYFPAKLQIERRLCEDVGEDLKGRGHDVEMWPDWVWQAGAMCLIRKDIETGRFSAAADPRRATYALGW